ncbi:MAG: type IV secretory system conjugative DNA transfer family protein [Rhizobiaceae bacterium]|nr:type IV secretory system conjugative DNA transfer family protein [Rhizobiaceae bacterium]
MSQKLENKPPAVSLPEKISAACAVFINKYMPGFIDSPRMQVLCGFGIGMVAMIIAYQIGALERFMHYPLHFNPHETGHGVYRHVIMAFSGLLGFALGWMMTPQAGPVRKIAIGLFLSVISFYTIFDLAIPGNLATTIGAWIAFFAGVGYWLRQAASKFMSLPNFFGDAKWATLVELIKAKVIGKTGLRIGAFEHRNGVAPIHYDRDRHALTIAPNRSGKGTTAIIPNLLTYEGSAVVIDPKGENAMITAARRKAMGQEVHVIDPFKITGLDTSRYNPMDTLVSGDPEIADKAMLLAEALIIVTEGEGRFWDEEAKSMLLGVILYVATEKSEAKHRHLARVRDLLTLDGVELRKLFGNMQKSTHRTVRSIGAMSLQKDEKLLANVMASVQAQTHFLESPAIRENLSASDFGFAYLKSKQVSVYLVLPSDKLDSHARWLRLMIQCGLSVLTQNIAVQPDKPVLFILDELPALGKLPMIEKAFGLMAGYGIKLWAIAQDASQLKRIYGEGWQTFVSNAGVIQYFGSRDKFTAEYFSSLCGVTTVWTFSNALARTMGSSYGGQASHSTSSGTTETISPAKRQLVNPDQLMRMKDHQQLVFINNMNPIMATKTPWFKDDELKDLGVNLHEKK